MAQILRLSCILLSLFLLTLVQAEHPVVHRRSRARAFIELQCKTTLYPSLCVRSLSSYVSNFTTTLSHRQLAQIALKVTLARAESTRAYVTGVAKWLNQTKARDYQAVKECLDQINDGVDQLANCIKETQNIKEDGEANDFPWHASNVQTWMSTALTDTGMCIDGFSGRAIGGTTKAMIKAKVLNLQQVTSNALALFNRFAARFRSSHVKKPKVL
ncbi:Pectinesterase inhibitor 9 [Sesamum angolense]|uniref:Pectinesterase inhibitor 9 n=1 Tax=Sesamum angolense TaxID=2727404 RepID=A0AAE1XFZ1_9LAMI|nr:Pectinesterase inhibitor 9 [Sesamum angolense]